MAPANQRLNWPAGIAQFSLREYPEPESIDQYCSFFGRLTILKEANQSFYDNLLNWRNRPYSMTLLRRGTDAAWRRLIQGFFSRFGNSCFGNERVVQQGTKVQWIENRAGAEAWITPILDEMFTYMASLKFKPNEIDEHAYVSPLFEEQSAPKRKQPDLSTARKSKRQKTEDDAIDQVHQVPKETVILERLASLENIVRQLVAQSDGNSHPTLPSTANVLTQNHSTLGTHEEIGPFLTASRPTQVTYTLREDESTASPEPSWRLPNGTDHRKAEEVRDGAGFDNRESSLSLPLPSESATSSAAPTPNFPVGEALAKRMMRYVHYARKHDPGAYNIFTTMLRDDLTGKLNSEADSEEESGVKK